jgi:hypothetical protein
MNITHEHSLLIAKLIEGYASESAPNPPDLRQLAAAERVLPLFVDMGGVIGINTKGDIVAFPFDVNAEGEVVAYPLHNEATPRVEADPRVRNIALFQGSKKYPELIALVPAQPDDAHVCPDCGGTGIEPNAAKLKLDNVVCYCGGLGWLP